MEQNLKLKSRWSHSLKNQPIVEVGLQGKWQTFLIRISLQEGQIKTKAQISRGLKIILVVSLVSLPLSIGQSEEPYSAKVNNFSCFISRHQA
jgi:hypothetical protein